MTDAQRPLWEKEESVVARSEPAFAFKYLTSIENVAADPGIERVETDGPYRDRPGMRGKTYHVGGGATDWVVTAVEPDRRFVIDVAMRDAFLRFEFRFEERLDGGSVVSQRVSLFGPNASEYVVGVEAGFGTTLRNGMRAIRDRMDAASTLMDSSTERREHDPSNGYEAAADAFMAGRGTSSVGVGTVRSWAQSLPRGSAVLDLGCGDGMPISQALLDAALAVWGVVASPKMVAAFRARFPESPVACEPVETSHLFGRRFDGAVAWGLMFLLPADAQLSLIHRMGSALNAGGRFLFTAPRQECRWADVLTGRESISLGTKAYVTALTEAGFTIVGEQEDEGENHYFDAACRGHVD